MKTRLIITALFFSFAISSYSQELFRTKNGMLIVMGSLQDTVAKLTSNKLITTINYEKAGISMKVKRTSFVTGNPDFDSIITRLKPDFLSFEGRFGIDFIPEGVHQPLEFPIEGTFTNSNFVKKINGRGRLESTLAAPFSTVLTIVFSLKLKDLDLNFGIEDLKEDIQVEIVQNLMDRSPY